MVRDAPVETEASHKRRRIVQEDRIMVGKRIKRREDIPPLANRENRDHSNVVPSSDLVTTKPMVAAPRRSASPSGSVRPIHSLRQLTHSCLRKRHFGSALFYADKLASLAPQSAQDELLFIECCYWEKQYKRAIALLQKSPLLSLQTRTTLDKTALDAFLLLGQCMLATDDHEEYLEYVGSLLPSTEDGVEEMSKQFDQVQDSEVNVVASLALVIADAYEAAGHLEKATTYWKASIRCDVRCSEAFFRLVEKQVLTAVDEKQLMRSLHFAKDETGMLKDLYASYIGKYDANVSVDDKFSSIDDKLGLQQNLDLAVAKAETLYCQQQFDQSLEVCERVRRQDPYNPHIITVYVGSMFVLKQKQNLYHYAHELVDTYPKEGSTWYSVGCYYLLADKMDEAQHYFYKATTMDASYAPAWVGFGNAFAAQKDSDQAVGCYRIAAKLFPANHLVHLYLGMEHRRTDSLLEAQDCLNKAKELCPTDPLIYNELGSVYFACSNYIQAVASFNKALELCSHLPTNLMVAWEPTLFNLGVSYRKLRKFDQAIRSFTRALYYAPTNASAHSALGFTYHLQGNLDQAIDCYHSALAYDAEDALAGEMITKAFQESLLSTTKDSSPMHTEPVARMLNLDQSYSSIEPNQQSLDQSNFDLSDDSL